jgi:hypothetical protein
MKPVLVMKLMSLTTAVPKSCFCCHVMAVFRTSSASTSGSGGGISASSWNRYMESREQNCSAVPPMVVGLRVWTDGKAHASDRIGWNHEEGRGRSSRDLQSLYDRYTRVGTKGCLKLR